MVTVIVDQRELRPSVAKELEKLNCSLVFKTLEVADYIASERVAFERKTAEDFLKSWLDEKKLFGQISDLCDAYERPVLIVEGGMDDLFALRRVHPNSVQGVLNTLAASFRCPILYTLNTSETAAVITSIAFREQELERRPIILHGKRSNLSPSELKEYVVSAIPDIGPVVSQNLLRHFKTIQAIFSSSEGDLMKVDLVGPETARRIREVVAGEYFESED